MMSNLWGGDRRVAWGKIGGQILLLMENFLHFSRVFEEKYQKSPLLNFFHIKIFKISPRKIPVYAAEWGP